MRGGFYLRIFYFKHNVSIISWKMCLRGIVPLKPKPSIALISTNENKTFLDLVLMMRRCFPCIYLRNRKEGKISSSSLAEPHVHLSLTHGLTSLG